MYDGRNKPGDYWAQDVVQIGYDQSCTSPCISGRFSVTFLDNVWNFSSASLDHNCGVSGEQGCMESGFHGGVGCTASNPSHDYYACTGSTIYGVVPPFSIVTKIIVNACGSSGTISCFLFSGQIRQAGADLFNSVFDVFEFTNSLSTTVRPTFHVSGTGHPPYPLPWDGEWVAAGACCGLSLLPVVDWYLAGILLNFRDKFRTRRICIHKARLELWTRYLRICCDRRHVRVRRCL